MSDRSSESTEATCGLGGATNTSTPGGIGDMLLSIAVMLSTLAESVAHFQLPPTMKVRPPADDAALRPLRALFFFFAPDLSVVIIKVAVTPMAASVVQSTTNGDTPCDMADERRRRGGGGGVDGGSREEVFVPVRVLGWCWCVMSLFIPNK